MTSPAPSSLRRAAVTQPPSDPVPLAIASRVSVAGRGSAPGQERRHVVAEADDAALFGGLTVRPCGPARGRARERHDIRRGGEGLRLRRAGANGFRGRRAAAAGWGGPLLVCRRATP